MNRYIPEGAAKIASKNSSAVAYVYERAGKVYALGFYGKQTNPDFHHTFRSQEGRLKFVSKWFKDMDARAERKAAARAEKAAKLTQPHKLAIGDVLRSSWGYDQTNIDYYQVVELVGKRSVRIRKIGKEAVESGYMQGESVPAKDHFIGDAMLKQVSLYDNASVKIASYASAYKMEPKTVAGVAVGYAPSHWTAYA